MKIIKKIVIKAPEISSKEITKQIKTKVTPRTIRNNLQKMGIHSRVAIKNPKKMLFTKKGGLVGPFKK